MSGLRALLYLLRLRVERTCAVPELAPDLRVSLGGGLLDLWRLAGAVDTASVDADVLPLELLTGPGMILSIPQVLHM